MGYAQPAQTARGIHMRLRSRAFIVAEPPEEFNVQNADFIASQQQHEVEDDLAEQERSLLRWNWKRKSKTVTQKNSLATMADPERTVCFVSIDAGMGSDLLNTRVVKRLEELLPEQGESGKRLCHLENLSIRYECTDHVASSIPSSHLTIVPIFQWHTYALWSSWFLTIYTVPDY